jgi:hypothetical protein
MEKVNRRARWVRQFQPTTHVLCGNFRIGLRDNQRNNCDKYRY